jgi:hypothetical protein
MTVAPSYPRVARFRTAAELRSHLETLAAPIPLDDEPLSAAAAGWDGEAREARSSRPGTCRAEPDCHGWLPEQPRGQSPKPAALGSRQAHPAASPPAHS